MAYSEWEMENKERLCLERCILCVDGYPDECYWLFHSVRMKIYYTQELLRHHGNLLFVAEFMFSGGGNIKLLMCGKRESRR